MRTATKKIMKSKVSRASRKATNKLAREAWERDREYRRGIAAAYYAHNKGK